MTFWLRFSLRSCLRRRRRSVITLLGIAFGVGMLITLGAIMVGVNDTMVVNAVSLRAGYVIATGKPLDMDDAVDEAQRWADHGRATGSVSTSLPRCHFPAFLQTEEISLPLQIWCVDPAAERQVSPIPRAMVAGGYLGSDEGAILGSIAADEADVAVDDMVTITTPDNEYELRVTGIFETGVDGIDRACLYVPVSLAKDFHEPLVTAEVPYFCAKGADLPSLKEALGDMDDADEVTVMTWQEALPEVAQLVDLNTFSMQIMTFLVIAILGFGVANALLVSVMDRYRYYAILKAIGARPAEVVTTVVGEAFFMCVSAGLVGTALGVVISLAWGHIGLDIGRYMSFNPHFSVDSVIHPRLTWSMALGPQALALAAGVLASLWPALVAARRTVSSGMRDL